MSRKEKAPVSLRIRLKYPDVDVFVARYAPNVSRGGMFIQSRAPQPVGTSLRFELLIAEGLRLLKGEARVVWVKEYDASKPGQAHGMGVRFTELDDESRSLVDRIVAYKQATEAPPVAQAKPTRVRRSETLEVRGLAAQVSALRDAEEPTEHRGSGEHRAASRSGEHRAVGRPAANLDGEHASVRALLAGDSATSAVTATVGFAGEGAAAPAKASGSASGRAKASGSAEASGRAEASGKGTNGVAIARAEQMLAALMADSGLTDEAVEHARQQALSQQLDIDGIDGMEELLSAPPPSVLDPQAAREALRLMLGAAPIPQVKPLTTAARAGQSARAADPSPADSGGGEAASDEPATDKRAKDKRAKGKRPTGKRATKRGAKKRATAERAAAAEQAAAEQAAAEQAAAEQAAAEQAAAEQAAFERAAAERAAAERAAERAAAERAASAAPLSEVATPPPGVEDSAADADRMSLASLAAQVPPPPDGSYAKAVETPEQLRATTYDGLPASSQATEDADHSRPKSGSLDDLAAVAIGDLERAELAHEELVDDSARAEHAFEEPDETTRVDAMAEQSALEHVARPPAVPPAPPAHDTAPPTAHPSHAAAELEELDEDLLVDDRGDDTDVGEPPAHPGYEDDDEPLLLDHPTPFDLDTQPHGDADDLQSLADHSRVPAALGRFGDASEADERTLERPSYDHGLLAAAASVARPAKGLGSADFDVSVEHTIDETSDLVFASRPPPGLEDVPHLASEEEWAGRQQQTSTALLDHDSHGVLQSMASHSSGRHAALSTDPEDAPTDPAMAARAAAAAGAVSAPSAGVSAPSAGTAAGPVHAVATDEIMATDMTYDDGYKDYAGEGESEFGHDPLANRGFERRASAARGEPPLHLQDDPANELSDDVWREVVADIKRDDPNDAPLTAVEADVEFGPDSFSRTGGQRPPSHHGYGQDQSTYTGQATFEDVVLDQDHLGGDPDLNDEVFEALAGIRSEGAFRTVEQPQHAHGIHPDADPHELRRTHNELEPSRSTGAAADDPPTLEALASGAPSPRAPRDPYANYEEDPAALEDALPEEGDIKARRSGLFKRLFGRKDS